MSLYGLRKNVSSTINNPPNNPANVKLIDTIPLGNGLESRIRGKRGLIPAIRGSGTIFLSSNENNPITTTYRTWGMPASSNHNLVSYLTTASTLKIASTNTNDTSAGTGLRRLTISGLNSNWDEISELITLNGQNPVVTSASFLRINSLFAEEVGSAGRNLGDIFVSNNADTFTGGIPNTQTLFAMLGSFDADNPTNLSHFGSYSVPRNHRLWLIKGNYYIDATDSKPLTLKEDAIYESSLGNRIGYTQGVIRLPSSRSIAFDGAGAYPEKTDYNFKCKSDTGTIQGCLFYEATLENMTLGLQ